MPLAHILSQLAPQVVCRDLLVWSTKADTRVIEQSPSRLGLLPLQTTPAALHESCVLEASEPRVPREPAHRSMHIMPGSGVPPTVHPVAGPARPPTVAISPEAPDSTSAPAALPSEHVYLRERMQVEVRV
jgi:hypothetical protein